MNFLQRDVVVVSPKKKYLNWAKSVFEDTTKLELQELGQASSAFLIDELDSHDATSCRVAMEVCWKKIAQEEFASWSTRTSDWPELKTLADFESYFEWKIHDLFGDLGEGPLLDTDQISELN